MNFICHKYSDERGSKAVGAKEVIVDVMGGDVM